MTAQSVTQNLSFECVSSNVQTQLDTKQQMLCNRKGCRIRIILNSNTGKNNYGNQILDHH